MKRRRKAPTSIRATKRARTGGVAIVPAQVAFPGPGRQQQFFVPRSFGNPRAITERKYFTTGLTSTALVNFDAGTTWAGCELDPATTNALFAPATGDDFNTRDGRKVQVLSIKIKGYFRVAAQTDTTTTDDAALIRLALVVDKQTNAAQLNAEDVFGGVAVAPLNVDQFQNPAFFGRFKVLKDKYFTLQNPNSTWDGTNMEQMGLVRHFKMTHKFRKPMIVHFNGTNGGTVADIIDNSFHLIGGSSNIELVPTIAYQVRTTFIDV